MESRKIELVQLSFAKVKPHIDKVSELFYKYFFEESDEIRSLFKGDLNKQRQMFMSALNLAINSLSNLGRITPIIEELGSRHVHFGAKPEQFDSLGRSLVRSMKEVAPDIFDSETEMAWNEALELIFQIMIVQLKQN
jgi:hemoglobin-like flavoprotein